MRSLLPSLTVGVGASSLPSLAVGARVGASFLPHVRGWVRVLGAGFLFLLFLFLSACTDSHSFRLRGDFQNLRQADLFIYSTDGGLAYVDTIHIVEGQFDWQVPLDEEVTFYLIFPNFSQQTVFARPGDVIKIQGDGGQLRALSIKGSPDNDELTRFRLAHLGDRPDSLRQAIERYVKENEGSRVSLHLMRQLTQQRKDGSRLRVGEVLPAIVLPPDSLQASKDTLFIRPKQKDARPVLLFFWATWKRSSLDDFYLVRKALRQNKELQPVSISLDYNASTYAYSLRADSIDFDRRCYRLIWDTPIVQQLAVRDIPYYILADANRRVIALGSDWKHDLQPAVDSLLNSRKDVQRP